MNSRERVGLTLSHEEPDRVPFDLGATVLTSIHRDAYRRLRDYLDLPDREIRMLDVIQQIVVVDDDVRELLGVDVAGVAPQTSSTFEIEIKDDMDGYTYFYDEWGIGWRMPKEGGFYYDMFDHPLKDAETFADIDNHPWPDPEDPARYAGLRERALRAAEEGEKAVFLSNFCSGLLEMAAWLRGFENYFADFTLNPKLMGYLLDTILELKLAYWEKALEEVGDVVDVVNEADDFSGQHAMLISPEAYRQFAKPRHKRLFDRIHTQSEAKVFFHSCGAVRPVIPDLIDIGVDVLNPVQVSAAGMDTGELKEEFGDDLVFWGGGVDTQRVLGAGTPQEVRDEVVRRIDDLAPGGGFVFAAVHNIQGDVPPENVMAMWEALREYGVYR